MEFVVFLVNLLSDSLAFKSLPVQNCFPCLTLVVKLSDGREVIFSCLTFCLETKSNKKFKTGSFY